MSTKRVVEQSACVEDPDAPAEVDETFVEVDDRTTATAGQTGWALLTVPPFAMAIIALAYAPLFVSVFVLTYLGKLDGGQAEQIVVALAVVLVACAAAMGSRSSVTRLLGQIQKAVTAMRKG